MMPMNSWSFMQRDLVWMQEISGFRTILVREGFDLIGAAMDVIRRKPSLKPLTIGMLELAAKMGRWDTKTLDEAYSNNSYIMSL